MEVAAELKVRNDITFTIHNGVVERTMAGRITAPVPIDLAPTVALGHFVSLYVAAIPPGFGRTSIRAIMSPDKFVIEFVVIDIDKKL